MIELILSTLNNIIAQILNFTISWWGSNMQLSMSTLIGKGDAGHGLPFLVTGYSIFQAMGLAFAIVIGAASLYNIFLSAGDARTSPVRVLVMTAAAVAMIYFGNNIAMLVVDFAKAPYDAFWSAPIGSTGVVVEIPSMVLDVSALFAGGTLLGNAVILTGVAKTAAIFIMSVAIAVALFKLYVELFERYVMVGVTVYAFAPLAYATIASDQTMQIFKRWASMFIGQLILMSLSVWSLKLILSGFAGMSDLFQCFLVLACCRVAQRLDTYLSQLGLNVVTTGGNLIDEAIGAGAAIVNTVQAASKLWNGGKGNNSKAILGENYGKEGHWGGLRGAVAQYNRARQGGASFSDAARAGAAGFTTTASARAQQIRTETGEREKAERTAATNTRNAQNAARNRNQSYPAAKERNGAFTKAFVQEAERKERTPWEYARQNLRTGGSGRFEAQSGGVAGLDMTAQRAGLSFNTADGRNPRAGNGSVSTPMPSVVGPEPAVKDFLAKNYNVAGTPAARSAKKDMQLVYRDAGDAVYATAKETTPRMAADVLAHPSYDLAGNDAVGNELMGKAFGASIDPSGGGRFSSVTAVTDGGDNGARRIYAVHTDREGRERGFEVMDEVGYYTADPTVQAGMEEIRSENGTRFFMHEMGADDVRKVSRATTERLDAGEPVAPIRKSIVDWDDDDNFDDSRDYGIPKGEPVLGNYAEKSHQDDVREVTHTTTTERLETAESVIPVGKSATGSESNAAFDTPHNDDTLKDEPILGNAAGNPHQENDHDKKPEEIDTPIAGETRKEKRKRTKKTWDRDR